MKSFLVLILLLAGSLLLTAYTAESYEPKGGYLSEGYVSPDLQITLERIELRLKLVQEQFAGKLNKSEMRELQNTLSEIRRLIFQLALPDPSLPRVMSEDDFDDLKERLKKLAFADDGLALLKTAAAGNYFSSSQIAGLLDQSTFPDDKLKALEISYPSCLDTSGNYRILDCFIFGDDKDKARAILER